MTPLCISFAAPTIARSVSAAPRITPPQRQIGAAWDLVDYRATGKVFFYYSRSSCSVIMQLHASQTAVRVALQRAVHQVLDAEPKVLIDPIAVGLFPAATEFAIQADATRHLEPGWCRIRANFVLRSRQTEDCLAEAVKRGIEQYVILGAGLDTFAYRQPGWARDLRIVEVDQPASQGFKVQCLKAAGVTVPENLNFFPIDFRAEALGEKLRTMPLSKSKPNFVSWLGVTQYLDMEAIAGTLEAIASWPGGSELVLEYIESDWTSLDPVGRKAMEDAVARATAAGEPWLSRFSGSAMIDLLLKSGFSEVRHLSMDDARDRYFRGRSDGLTPAGGIAMLWART
jgi:methyltransferase (TIGR00027 family)